MYSHLSQKWESVKSVDDLQPRNVVFMFKAGTSKSSGNIQYVQIYAGNGQWYNAGSTWAIQSQKTDGWGFK